MMPNVLKIDLREQPTLREVEQQMIAAVLRRCSYNISDTARALGVSRRTVQRHLNPPVRRRRKRRR
jgi:ActR/RegA family two-component response regulator